MKNTGELIVPIYGLTLKDQVELGRRMVLFQDEAAREALILNCVPMVKAVAALYTCYCSYDDIFQYGMLGALEAIDKYDYTKNVKFTSYAFFFIQKRIITGVREQLPISISERDYFRSSLVKNSIKTYVEEIGDEPSDEEIAEVTGLSSADVAYFRKYDVSSISVSFQDYMENNDIVSNESDIACLFEKALVNSTGKQAISEAFALLNDNERRIIIGRYFFTDKKLTYRELAAEQDVAINTIKKREKKALMKFYKYFSDNNYKFEDLLYHGGA
jgi:RNA polymerase sigma factor (sigma-70 family)